MKWKHARKGIIEGVVVREVDEFVDIRVAKRTRIANSPDPFKYGIRPVHAAEGSVVRLRKSLLTELKDERDN